MPFDPASLSGKLLWLRAKDLGANGSSVNTWPDQSGTSHDALQGGVAPTVATGSTPLGGKSVRFGGTSHLNFINYRGATISAALASTEFSAQYAAVNAIDFYPEQGGNNNVWASTTLPAWLRLQPSSSTVVTSYNIIARIGSSVNQSPKDWTFEGSNDGSSWTTLDTQTGITFSAGQIKSFSFSNSTAYTYYRINITAVNGSTLAAIAELTLNPVAGYGINNPIGASQTAAEVWVVAKADTGGNRGMWSWGEDTAAAMDSYYQHSNGNVYESFGLTNGNRQNFVPTEPTANWQVYRVRNNGTTWEAWQSGNTQLTASSKPFGYGAIQTIGMTRVSSAPSGFFAGNIAEIYMRDTISTSQEASDLFDYFISEHIGTANIQARTEAFFAEAMVAGTAASQVEAFFAEGMVMGTAGSQVEAFFAEAMVPVQPAQVETVYAESLINTTPPAQTESIYAESLMYTTPPVRMESQYLEVLLLPVPSTSYTGWGTPI